MKPYKLSKNYRKLYKRIRKGFIAVGFVNYVFSDKVIERDVCKINKSEDCIFISARGISYGTVYPGFILASQKTEEDYFIKVCEKINLMWIEV